MSEVKWRESRSVVSDSLWPRELYSPWDSPGQNTGVSSLSLLQGIFPTQGSNPGLPCCRQSLYPLSHQGSPVSACFSAFHLRNWKDVALILAPLSPSSESFSRNPALQSTLSSSLLLKGVFPDSSECLFSLHQVNKSDFVRLHFCSWWSLAD